MRLKPVRGSIIGKTSTTAANNEISLRWSRGVGGWGGHASGCVYGPRVNVELGVSFCRFTVCILVPSLLFPSHAAGALLPLSVSHD